MPGVYLVDDSEFDVLFKEEVGTVVPVSNFVPEWKPSDDGLLAYSVDKNRKSYHKLELLSEKQILCLDFLEKDLPLFQIPEDLVKLTQKIRYLKFCETLSFFNKVRKQLLIALRNDEYGVIILNDF